MRYVGRHYRLMRMNALLLTAPLPPACPPIVAGLLRPGDIIVQNGTEWVGQTIEEMTKSPWSHVAMIVRGPYGLLYVVEMTWPRCRRTLLATWLKSNEAWVYQLSPVLTDEQAADLWAWWNDRLGNPYDVVELLRIGNYILALKVAIALHLPSWLTPNPPHGNGVCSVYAAMALQSIGLLPGVDPYGVYPSTVPSLPCVTNVRKVVLS